MNQSELEAIHVALSAGKRLRATYICLGFTSDWLTKWARDILANHKAKQCKTIGNATLPSTLN